MLQKCGYINTSPLLLYHTKNFNNSLLFNTLCVYYIITNSKYYTNELLITKFMGVFILENNELEKDFENRHLDETISIAKKQLISLRISNQEKKDEITVSKKEIPEESSHYISNLWSMENFHELVELSQFANPISDKIYEAEREATKILILEKMINSPYFARIDFKFDDENEYEKIYIGISSLIDEQANDICVYDWRSPISSVFYRFCR